MVRYLKLRKRLTSLQRCAMKASLLGFLLDVGGEIPPLFADPALAFEAKHGDVGETMVRACLPQPIGERLDVVTIPLFTLPQRLRCTSLSSTEGSDQEGGKRKQCRARYLGGLHGE